MSENQSAPLTEVELKAFWSRVDNASMPGHWIWMGEMLKSQAYFHLRGMKVAASKVAWHITYPDHYNPFRLERKPTCTDQRCINPVCRTPLGRLDDKPIIPAKVEYKPRGPRRMRASTGPLGAHEEMSVPPLLDALSAIQFGTEVTTSRKLRFRNEPHMDVGGSETPVQDALKQTPLRLMPLDYAVREFLLTPGTATIVFPGGSTKVYGPWGKIDADSPEAAVDQVRNLIHSRQHGDAR